MALDPPPEVLAAMKSDDLEIQRRATHVAGAMRGNLIASRLRRGNGFAEQGRVDLFVAANRGLGLKATTIGFGWPAQGSRPIAA